MQTHFICLGGCVFSLSFCMVINNKYQIENKNINNKIIVQVAISKDVFFSLIFCRSIFC